MLVRAFSCVQIFKPKLMSFLLIGFLGLFASATHAQKDYLAPWLYFQEDVERHVFLQEKGENQNQRFFTVEFYSSSIYFDLATQKKTLLTEGDKVSQASYFRWFQWDRTDPTRRYSSEFALLGEKLKPLFQQYHSIDESNHYNQYLSMNEGTPSVPELAYQSSNVGQDKVELRYDLLYTEDMLIPLLRKLLWDKQKSLEINLLGNLSNPPGNYRVQYAKIEVMDRHFPIKEFGDNDVVLVEVTRDDGRLANYWFSREGNHRLIKAILHDGSVLTLIEYERLKKPK